MKLDFVPPQMHPVMKVRYVIWLCVQERKHTLLVFF